VIEATTQTKTEVKAEVQDIKGLSLKDLNVNIRLISKIKDLTENISDSSKREAFRIYTEDNVKIMYLPSNYADVINKSYMYKLYLKIFEECKGRFALLDKISYETSFRSKPSLEAYIKGFGILLTNKEIPKIPSNTKSLYTKGIFCALRHYYSSKKNFNPKFFRFRNAAHLSTYMLGDVWGKKYPVEKYIIDQLIRILRNKQFLETMLHTYMLPNTTIRDENGINLKKPSKDLFTDSELTLIKLYTDTKLKDWRLFTLNKYKNQIKFDYLTLNNDVTDLQRVVRDYKKAITLIESDRLRAVYSKMTSKEKQRTKKIPIRVLIDNLKGTDDYVAFNPTNTLKLFGAQVKVSPNVNVKKDSYLEQFKTAANRVCKEVGTSLIDNIRIEFLNFLSDLGVQ
jgi:hypothetical protein